MNFVIKEDGIGVMTLNIGNEKEETPLIRDDSKSQICFSLNDDDCLTYKLDGDSFTVDQPQEGFCEDDDDGETNHDTKSICEAAEDTWVEASCSQMEFIKK